MSRLIQLDWLKALHNSKQEWTSESVHETCIHQRIQRQQQSAGKHAHIPEQSVQPRYAMQQCMDHGHISWLQIKYKEHHNNHIYIYKIRSIWTYSDSEWNHRAFPQSTLCHLSVSLLCHRLPASINTFCHRHSTLQHNWYKYKRNLVFIINA